MNPDIPAYKKNAAIISLIILLLLAASIFFLLYSRYKHGNQTGEHIITADIYQDGELLYSLNLTAAAAPYTLEILSADGGHNLVEVRAGSIGITHSDCPDQLCVRQGFIHSALLPVTCLPHRLIIQIRTPAADNTDIITH